MTEPTGSDQHRVKRFWGHIIDKPCAWVARRWNGPAPKHEPKLVGVLEVIAALVGVYGVLSFILWTLFQWPIAAEHWFLARLAFLLLLWSLLAFNGPDPKHEPKQVGVLQVIAVLAGVYSVLSFILWTLFQWSIAEHWMLALGSFVLFWSLLAFCAHRYLRDHTDNPDPGNHEERARFKDWIIPLYNFRFHHEPYRRESSRTQFIGREALAEDFLALLHNSNNSSGSYLVTGYRGVGKTSLVKKVLHDYADGRHHLSLREKYDLFGLYQMSLWHRFTCWRGRRMLNLHKRLAKKTEAWREKGRPAPRFINAWNLGTYLLFLHRIIPVILVLIALYFLLGVDPNEEGKTDVADVTVVVIFILVAFLLFVMRQFFQHRFAIFNPGNWWRWLRRPVVVIHINLGHERLDPKKILFGLVHLLRQRYREPFRMLSPANIVRVVVILLLSLVVSLLVYDLSSSANHRLEAALQGALFKNYTLYTAGKVRTRSTITAHFGTPIHPARPRCGKGCIQQVCAPFRALSDGRLDAQKCAVIVERVLEGASGADNTPKAHPAHSILDVAPCEQGGVGANKCTLVQVHIDDDSAGRSTSLPEREKEQGAGPGLPLEKPDDVTVTLTPLPSGVNDQGGTSRSPDDTGLEPTLDLRKRVRPWQAEVIARQLGSDMGRARALCDSLAPGKYTLLQSLYCSLDGWVVAAYCNNDSVSTIGCDNRSEDDLSHPEQWVRLGLSQVFEAVKSLSEGVLKNQDPDKEPVQHHHSNAPRPYNIVFFLIVLALIRAFLGFFGRARVTRMLDFARERIVATDNVEVGGGGGAWPLIGRRRRQYDPLDIRQTEAMILDILEANRRIPRFLPQPDIVFVFDELDKIKPATGDVAKDAQDQREYSLNQEVRRRKVEVEELLSNLKNLITVAACRFIFIAGRDMMDANLADQTAASHLYSSLFDKVIYVPSFLTDTSDGNEEDISSMVEQYVCRRLMPHAIAYHIYHEVIPERTQVEPPCDKGLAQCFDNYRFWSLEVYACYLLKIAAPNDKENAEAEGLAWGKQELMTVLQDFVYYLTYRSGGNPKKIALQFEHFVTPLSDTFLTDRVVAHRPAGPLLPTTHFMLRIPPSGQYEIQLISQVFLLFHGESSALIRKYGDKLAVATFSILDYLLKFHSSGFNSRDLERMPDVLDINRAPALPQLIDLLLGRILAPYLRRVDNGIYEYRFLLHFQREVTYISQFSEQELAAFNFTLDESMSIKQHFRDLRDKQVSLRVEQAPVLWPQGVNNAKSMLRHGGSLALPYIDSILGDLHNMDRQHEKALTEYRNVLDELEPAVSELEAPEHVPEPPARQAQTAWPTNNAPAREPEFRNVALGQIILYLRTLLKSGLIYEQRNEFSPAAAAYTQAKRMVERVMRRFPSDRLFSNNINQLALVTQPYICLAFLYAKRDALTNRALQFLDEGEQALTTQNFFPGHEHDYPADSIARNNFLRIRLHLRRAELLLFRSDLGRAAYGFGRAAQDLTQWVMGTRKGGGKGFAPDPDGLTLPMQLLGYALSGFGDACSGLDLRDALGFRGDDEEYKVHCEQTKRHFSTERKQRIDTILDLRGTHRGAGVEDVLERLETFLDDTLGPRAASGTGSTAGDRIPDGFKQAIEGCTAEVYAHSAAIYRSGGKPAKAALALWKGAYFFSFGFGYWPDWRMINIPSAQERLTIAQRKFMQAQKNVDRANREFNQANEEYEQADKVHERAKKNVVNARNRILHAKKALIQLQSQGSCSSFALTEKRDKLSEEEKQHSVLLKDRIKAENKLKEAKDAKNRANDALDSANVALSHAKKSCDSAEESIHAPAIDPNDRIQNIKNISSRLRKEVRDYTGIFFRKSWKNADLPPKAWEQRPLVHEFGMESFRGAYLAHRTRLKKLHVEKENILKWTSPPLSQSMIVLGAFWEAWCDGLTSSEALSLSDKEVAICDMGAFPVYPRILAAFLKGRWNFSQAFPNLPDRPLWLLSPGKVPQPPDTVYQVDDSNRAHARNAFRFLVDAAENGEAYEGGLALLNPSLGFIYYHLWLTLHALEKSTAGKKILGSLRESDEFRGERRRFFEQELMRITAKTHLRDMWARHGNDEGFFTYAENRHYLTDSFSDSYVNGLWAVEYGLLPVASSMLKCLCCD